MTVCYQVISTKPLPETLFVDPLRIKVTGTAGGVRTLNVISKVSWTASYGFKDSAEEHSGEPAWFALDITEGEGNAEVVITVSEWGEFEDPDVDREGLITFTDGDTIVVVTVIHTLKVVPLCVAASTQPVEDFEQFVIDLDAYVNTPFQGAMDYCFYDQDRDISYCPIALLPNTALHFTSVGESKILGVYKICEDCVKWKIDFLYGDDTFSVDVNEGTEDTVVTFTQDKQIRENNIVTALLYCEVPVDEEEPEGETQTKGYVVEIRLTSDDVDYGIDPNVCILLARTEEVAGKSDDEVREILSKNLATTARPDGSLSVMHYGNENHYFDNHPCLIDNSYIEAISPKNTTFVLTSDKSSLQISLYSLCDECDHWEVLEYYQPDPSTSVAGITPLSGSGNAVLTITRNQPAAGQRATVFLITGYKSDGSCIGYACSLDLIVYPYSGSEEPSGSEPSSPGSQPSGSYDITLGSVDPADRGMCYGQLSRGNFYADPDEHPAPITVVSKPGFISGIQIINPGYYSVTEIPGTNPNAQPVTGTLVLKDGNNNQFSLSVIQYPPSAPVSFNLAKVPKPILFTASAGEQPVHVITQPTTMWQLVANDYITWEVMEGVGVYLFRWRAVNRKTGATYNFSNTALLGSSDVYQLYLSVIENTSYVKTRKARFQLRGITFRDELGCYERDAVYSEVIEVEQLPKQARMSITPATVTVPAAVNTGFRFTLTVYSETAWRFEPQTGDFATLESYPGGGGDGCFPAGTFTLTFAVLSNNPSLGAREQNIIIRPCEGGLMGPSKAQCVVMQAQQTGTSSVSKEITIYGSAGVDTCVYASFRVLSAINGSYVINNVMGMDNAPINYGQDMCETMYHNSQLIFVGRATDTLSAGVPRGVEITVAPNHTMGDKTYLVQITVNNEPHTVKVIVKGFKNNVIAGT
jgi:hypothetical protein